MKVAITKVDAYFWDDPDGRPRARDTFYPRGTLVNVLHFGSHGLYLTKIPSADFYYWLLPGELKILSPIERLAMEAY